MKKFNVCTQFDNIRVTILHNCEWCRFVCIYSLNDKLNNLTWNKTSIIETVAIKIKQ